MSQYLYGASVQGIQGFIFATNKLQEIVGASEIVKNIEEQFEEFVKDYSVEILMKAAGNIKAIFNNEDECKKVVLEFSRQIQQSAFGITLSQSVVKFDTEKYTQDDINTLMQNIKIQRNKPSISLDMNINILALAPSTAKPITKYIQIQKKATPIDKATEQKRDAYDCWIGSKEKSRNKEFRNISDFSNGKNKIAVIHIDGNGLGQLIPKLKMPLSKFSQKLDDATKKAFKNSRDETMDIREIILGGDDVTVICNANNALEFTKRFLENFKEETKGLGDNGLTACAGIAYCNEKYPFHYAVNLAEELCTATKKHAKNINQNLAPSSLMFHNIQSSNFQSWDAFVNDELTISNDKKTVRLDFGPYYLTQEGQALIKDFQNTVEAYRCDGSPISRLRNWLSELYKSDEYANNLLSRINEVTQQSGKWNCEIMKRNLENLYPKLSNEKIIIDDKDDDKYNKTPIYDVLQILSVTEIKGAKK